MVCLLLIAGLTYYLQSKQLSVTISGRIASAGEKEAWEEQIKWLHRLRLLQPENQDVTISLAQASEAAVKLPPKNRVDRVKRARTYLSESIAALESDSPPERGDIAKLRRFLIERDLQLGPRYAKDLQRQLIKLAPPTNDPEMLRALAFSRYSIEKNRGTPPSSAEPASPGRSPWEELLQQPIEDAFLAAWRANPHDLDLASQLAGYCQDNEFTFSSESDSTANSVSNELETWLTANASSGRAALLLFALRSIDAPDAAASNLQAAVPAALKRLNEYASSRDTLPEEELVADTNSSAIMTLPPAFFSERYDPNWDFLLVLEHAKLVASAGEMGITNRGNADKIQDLLTLPEIGLERDNIEAAYRLRAQTLTAAGNPQAAISVLREGVARFATASIDLQFYLLTLLCDVDDVEDLTGQLELLTLALQKQKAELVAKTTSQISLIGRVEEEEELARQEWRLGVLKGQLALRQAKLRDAARMLSQAVAAPGTASIRQRLWAMRLLAECYERQSLWDLAASIHEQASFLDSTGDVFTVQAANAWTKAGNIERASELWATVETNSIPASIRLLRARITGELANPPSQRNYKQIRTQLDFVRTKVEETPSDKLDDDLRSKLLADLEILALAIPEREDGGDRKAAIDRLTSLAESRPDNAALQRLCVLSHTAAGNREEAEKFFKRMIATDEDPDGFQRTLVKVEMAQTFTTLEAAIDLLVAYANKNPDNARLALETAARKAELSGDQELAFELLESIPTEERVPSILFRMQRLLRKQEDGTPENTAKIRALENEMRTREGNDGTWWRLCQANRLLRSIQQKPSKEIANSDALATVQQLEEEIRAYRPNWGMGQTLRGRLSLLHGDKAEALLHLQNGVDNGDRSLSASVQRAQLLLEFGRLKEAEAEYSRLERLRNTNTTVTALATAISQKKGNYGESLRYARTATESNAKSVESWLLLGHTAIIAARQTSEPNAKDSLLIEARLALDTALELSENASVSAFQLRLQFQYEFFGEDGLRSELGRIASSNLPESYRNLLVGTSYLRIGDTESAFPFLDQAAATGPDDPRVYLALSMYYRAVGNEQGNISALEKGLSVAPADANIRNRLAIALALRDGNDVSWDRLDALLGEVNTQTPSNQILHALILLRQGGATKATQAEQILRRIIASNGSQTIDATRLLTDIQRRNWRAAKESGSDPQQTARILAEARSLFGTLINRKAASPIDFYRLGDLLLEAEQIQEVEPLATRLESTTNGSPFALDLRLRLAKQNGDTSKVQELTKQWADKASLSDQSNAASILGLAGRVLLNLGYTKESVSWFEKSYQENPATYRMYAAALCGAADYQRAIDLCIDVFNETEEAGAVTTLAEAIVLSNNFELETENIRKIFNKAVRQFPNSPALLEALGTLSLAREEYPLAIDYYRKAERLSPNSVRILNNLAIALTELPNARHQATEKIKRAITIGGRDPELLDTKGMVHLRLGEIDKAISSFQAAVNASKDPRHRFHLLTAHLKKGNELESRAIWLQLNKQKLRRSVLTPSERIDLRMIEAHFKKTTK